MSEDDRAAKAARAKALLKKRQAKKAAETGGGPPSPRIASPAPRIASPSPTPSGTFSPASSAHQQVTSPLSSVPASVSPPTRPSLGVEEKEKQESNVSDVFAIGPMANGNDSSWLSGLTRVEASSPPASVPATIASPAPRYAAQPPPPAATSRSSTSSDKEREDLRALVRDQNSTIEALEAEKVSLAASLSNLSQVGQKAHLTQELLQAEQAKSTQLENTVRVLQTNVEQFSRQVQERQEVIASLLAERDNLEASISKLDAALHKAQQIEKELHAERQNSTKLQEQVQGLDQTIHQFSEQVEQQQQTISLLVSEKASLSSAVERLESAEAALQEAERRLEDELSRSGRLLVRVTQLESEAAASADQLAALTETERGLTDKTRDQEREIQLLNGTVHELRTQSEEHQRRVHELEEQIESDDRAERLEETLKNTQDRADELEFQLSKLRQTHEQLHIERGHLTGELQQKTAAEADWRARHAEVEKQHLAIQEELSSVISARDSLLGERTVLQTKIEGEKDTNSELQQKLASLVSDLAANARQLKQVQAELKAASARADDAEKTQKELQAEGIGLMRSLDEMRPKIVELTDDKLLFSEKIEDLQRAVTERDGVIAQLEASLEERREEKTAIKRERDALQAALDNERAALQKDSTELQQAYSELQVELTNARKSAADFEDDLVKTRLVANSNVDEIRRLTDSLNTQSAQLAALRSELAERMQAETEGQELLGRTQAEIESLRATQAQKDEELERLREVASSPSSRAEPQSQSQSQSLDREMLSALKQQHALELSASNSKVRALETSVFNAEAQVHALQRQVSVLENELRSPAARPSSRNSLHHQPPSSLPRRTASRAVDSSDELRRASFNAHRPGPSPPPTLSAFEGLSPEARHKRKVSLSMLKARIDSEVAASNDPRPLSRNSKSSPISRPGGLPVVIEPPSQPATPPPPHGHARTQSSKRPVFMDESHIFWCHSCQGDLVVL